MQRFKLGVADKIADIDNSINVSTKKTSEHHFIPEYTYLPNTHIPSN